MQQTWEMIPKSQDDNSLITDAIADAIDDHNNDVDAHLGPNQAMQSHRAAEIIDHLAESVVNDKLKPISRAYTAIVDPTTEYDYDTINSAHDYVKSIGGGNVLVRAGTHYLSETIELDGTVNFIGEDLDTTIIITDYTDDKYFEGNHWTPGWNGRFTFTNLSFVSIDGCTFAGSLAVDDYYSTIYFDNCNFTGDVTHLFQPAGRLILNDCSMQLNEVAAIVFPYKTFIRDIQLYSTVEDTILRFMTDDTHEYASDVFIDGLQADIAAGTGVWYYANDGLGSCKFTRCFFARYLSSDATLNTCLFIGCEFYLTIQNTMVYKGYSTRFIGCLFFANAGYGVTVVSGSTDMIFTGNYNSAYWTDSGTRTIISGNNTPMPYSALSGSTTAVGLRDALLVNLVVNSARTLTTTVPGAGQKRTLQVRTNTATSYLIQFGTGFETQGSLTTVATANRLYCIEFISNGTKLVEMSRTGALSVT